MIALILSACATTLIVALRYLGGSGLFAWMTARVRPGLYREQSRQIGREIGWSLVSCAITGIPSGIIAWGWRQHGWTRIYDDPASHGWWWLPLSLALYLFLYDTWFYWTHRWMHRPAVFRRVHAIHHASRPPTAWAAMSFHPVEAAIVGLFVPALVFVIPIQTGVLGLVLMIMTVMGITNHMGWELFPRALVHTGVGHGLITASHHHRHHELYRCNYGLFFRFWDHLCGTDRGVSTP